MNKFVKTHLAVISAFVSDKIPITADVNGVVPEICKSFYSLFYC